MTLEQYIAAKNRVLLVGPPATGKTSRLESVAARLGWDFEISTPGIQERCDFAGVFAPDLAAGICRALPLEQLDRLLKTTRPTLWLWDDLGNAPTDVQAALKGQITRGGRFYRHPHITICAATNRVGDATGCSRLHESLRSEFDLAFAICTPGSEEKPDGATFLGTWKAELDGWCDWALDNNAPAEIVAWHRNTSGRTLYGWKPIADAATRLPDFRSWSTVIRLWNAGLRDLRSISAAIGKAPAAEFLAFAALADQLPSTDQIYLDPQGAPVPTDSAALYLLAGMLSASVDHKTAGALCIYISRMPRVFAAFAARDSHRKLGAKLSANREWQKWFVANQELFAVGT